jgi:hypothetical protein
MVKLPPYPLKIEGVGEDHPFVAEALRSRKHYEPCWCGSGQKYKICHRLREQQEPLTLGQLLHEQELVFWKSRGCMHAQASSANCGGRVIDSHTIQRKGPLERIVDADNHVCRLAPSRQGGMALEEVGWRQASVFPGYCAKHDSVTFAPLERTPFTGTHEQCVLQSYRRISGAGVKLLSYLSDDIFICLHRHPRSFTSRTGEKRIAYAAAIAEVLVHIFLSTSLNSGMISVSQWPCSVRARFS